MQNDINRFLRQESGDKVFFTTMIDLCGLHADFPGVEKADKLRNDPYRRVEVLECSWRAETSDRRFIPYIQYQDRIPWITLPWTSVSRKSRPPKR